MVDAAIPGRYLMVCLTVVIVRGLGKDRTASTVSLFKNFVFVLNAIQEIRYSHIIPALLTAL